MARPVASVWSSAAARAAAALLCCLLLAVPAAHAVPTPPEPCGTLDLTSPLTQHCFPEDGSHHFVCCVDIAMPENPHSPHGNYNPLERVIKAASNSTSYSWCTCSEEICEQQLGGQVAWNMNGLGWKGYVPPRTRLGPNRPMGGERSELRLVLMRHAESEERRGVRDHDRAITEQGAATARRVAEQLQQLADSGWTPQVVVCSNARRTRQTLDVMSATWPALAEADSHFLGSLYTTAALDGQTRAHLSDIVAAEAAPEHSCCLCLGHNKGWEEAASSFAGEAVKLGNSCAALLEGRGASWADALAADSQWRLVRLLSPEA